MMLFRFAIRGRSIGRRACLVALRSSRCGIRLDVFSVMLALGFCLSSRGLAGLCKHQSDR